MGCSFSSGRLESAGSRPGWLPRSVSIWRWNRVQGGCKLCKVATARNFSHCTDVKALRRRGWRRIISLHRRPRNASGQAEHGAASCLQACARGGYAINQDDNATKPLVTPGMTACRRFSPRTTGPSAPVALGPPDHLRTRPPRSGVRRRQARGHGATAPASGGPQSAAQIQPRQLSWRKLRHRQTRALIFRRCLSAATARSPPLRLCSALSMRRCAIGSENTA
ncbi:hypothetical protein Thiosp_02494 [Thiorhodovibrio litoralis]|nr:hypothetical protein Thiosp_02494 [Thiorhodovibrio litoralis]